MKLHIDSQFIDISCKGCGNEMPETLGRLKLDNKLSCVVCGAVTLVDLEKLNAGIEEVERKLDDLRRGFRKNFK